MGKKNANSKPKAEKKERKQRAKMRSRKDSVAGHYADKLRAYSKQANDVMAKVEGFPGVKETETTEDIIAVLEGLATAGYVAPRKNSGRKAAVFVAGQKVTLQPEAVAMLKFQFPALGVDTSEFFVSDGYTPLPKDKQLPLRVGSSELTAPAVGFVNRAWIQSAAPVSASA